VLKMARLSGPWDSSDSHASMEKRRDYLRITMNAVPDRMLTVREAAERLAVSTKHLRRLIAANRLRSVSVGIAGSTRVRVPESSVVAFIAGEPSNAINIATESKELS
jgi:excisionase family DNA binding protein